MLFQIDKFLHFAVSFVIALVSPQLSAALGMLKEIFDYAVNGAIDGGDMVANALGIVLAGGLL